MKKEITYKILKETKLPHSIMEYEVEVAWKDLEAGKPKAIKHMQEHAEFPGFRKGKVPEKMIIEKVGILQILEDAAEDIINNTYPLIIEEKKIDPLGRPEVLITKLAENNPLEFKIKTAVMPVIELPDYKKIAKDINEKKETIEVTDKDVEDQIEKIRNHYAHAGHDHKEGERHDHPLPEFNDEFVKQLGDFKDVEDFKKKLREEVKKEKESRAFEKNRLTIVEEIVSKTETDLPLSLIESELSKMIANFKDDVTRMGVKLEDYLNHIKKTEEDLRKEWKSDAEKRAKMNIALNEIAIKEKIEADPKDIEEQAKHILEHNKEADPMRAKIYVTHFLTIEKVFQFLEKQK